MIQLCAIFCPDWSVRLRMHHPHIFVVSAAIYEKCVAILYWVSDFLLGCTGSILNFDSGYGPSEKKNGSGCCLRRMFIPILWHVP